MPGGTRDSCGSESRYHSVAPVVIAPTASVTISALSSSTATRKPLMSPIRVAKNSAATTAVRMASSLPAETPSTIVLDNVTTAGIDRSMPRAIRTRVSPMAAMPRNAANGMMARNVDGSRLRGTMMAQTTISPIIANQIAAKRICNGPARDADPSAALGSAESLMALASGYSIARARRECAPKRGVSASSRSKARPRTASAPRWS